jgi:hypothetical protein
MVAHALTLLLVTYPWLQPDAKVARRLEDAFPAPKGFHRVALADDGFGAWLRGLPLRPPGTPVRSFRGDVLHEGTDPRVAAVVELDVGDRDLQQCADSIMRLDAEWKWAAGHGDEIRYSIGRKQYLTWSRWKGSRNHASLRAFMDVVFAEAGTENLEESTPAPRRADLRPGDFFVLGGHPGHAVLILDVAEDGAGHRRTLLGQGFMPAQDFHVLAHDGDPWFSLDGDRVETPFWAPFPWSSLRRMP